MSRLCAEAMAASAGAGASALSANRARSALMAASSCKLKGVLCGSGAGEWSCASARPQPSSSSRPTRRPRLKAGQRRRRRQDMPDFGRSCAAGLRPCRELVPVSPSLTGRYQNKAAWAVVCLDCCPHLVCRPPLTPRLPDLRQPGHSGQAPGARPCRRARPGLAALSLLRSLMRVARSGRAVLRAGPAAAQAAGPALAQDGDLAAGDVSVRPLL